MDNRLVHEAVRQWYAENARELPWRHAPFRDDPYAVLVSEVMLQQTQVDRTVPKFLEFMERFPSFEALAEASTGDVIMIWSGMGYNNRAVRLQRLAEVVVRDYEGELPSGVDELRKLPGIGPYTASAIACFAFGTNVAVLDTNIYRVLSRVANGVDAPSRKEIEPLAEAMLPYDDESIDASTWHQGLMDIGATLCTVAKPRCMLCPLREHCVASPSLQDGTNRTLAEASVPYAPKQSRFAGSTRFYRGRIVDALRGAGPAGLALSELAHVDDQQRGHNWLSGIVDNLVKDGLAVIRGNRVLLP